MRKKNRRAKSRTQARFSARSRFRVWRRPRRSRAGSKCIRHNGIGHRHDIGTGTLHRHKREESRSWCSGCRRGHTTRARARIRTELIHRSGSRYRRTRRNNTGTRVRSLCSGRKRGHIISRRNIKSRSRRANIGTRSWHSRTSMHTTRSRRKGDIARWSRHWHNIRARTHARSKLISRS